jgi:hypothetical protein
MAGISESARSGCSELSAISEALHQRAEKPDQASESSVIAVLGERLRSIVRSHNTASVIFHFSACDAIYVLKVEFGQASTLRREIQWYRDAISIGHPHGLFVGSHVGEGFSFLILRYFGDTSTVDDAALSGASAGELKRHIVRALTKDADLLSRTRRTAALDYVHGLAARRFHHRRTQAMSYPYLRALLTAEFIRINGTSLRPLAWCWEQVADVPSIVEYLTPRVIGMTFGDLHCGNILVDGSATEVVDPRGGPLLPITYDYGKLVQSIEGSYGAIMAGRYTLRRLGDGQYEFSVRTPPGYRDLTGVIAGHCDERRYLQSLYQAALHFAAMLPHHASLPAEAVALHMSGTLLFNRLIARLK